MKIKVIGKAHLKGTSRRTGNPYDFIQVHYNSPAQGVEGIAALTVNLNPSQVNYDSIAVSGEYNVEFDQRGYPVVFAPVSGK